MDVWNKVKEKKKGEKKQKKIKGREKTSLVFG